MESDRKEQRAVPENEPFGARLCRPCKLLGLFLSFPSEINPFIVAGAVELWASAAWQIQQPRETGIPEQNT